MPMLLAGKNGKELWEMVIDVDCSDQQEFFILEVRKKMKIIFFWGLFSVFVILLIAQMITLIPILKKEIAIVFYTYR